MTKSQFIQQTTSIQAKNIQSTLQLLDEGATIPFISRYRKEQTGGLDEVEVKDIRDAQMRYEAIVQRQQTILKAIDEKGTLSQELKERIQRCFDPLELEDIYLPFKEKRKSKASVARENGLESLAKMIMSQKGNDPEQLALRFRNNNVKTKEECLDGAGAIIGEWIVENSIVRARLREFFEKRSMVSCKVAKGKEDEATKYSDYFDYSESAQKIPSHRFLAIFRGNREGVLSIKVRPEDDVCISFLERFFVKGNGADSDFVAKVCKEIYRKSLRGSLETERMNALKLKSDKSAIKVFAKNLEQLLLAAPVGQKRILAIDPGFKSGCKVVCIDENGGLLNNCTIYPHAPQKEMTKAKSKIAQLVQMYKIEAIAIGDGTAGRETEYMIKRIHFDRDVEVYVVNEDGASVYSASSIARKEFPQYDVTVRGAVSIGRRLMDPLAELVKIDPKSVGVGQYQHEVNQTLLKETLDEVIFTCVNKVGVEVNTASPYLLKYVSGLGETLADNIIHYRQENGSFQSLHELKNVKRFGEKAFEQSAGFLRIREGRNILDNTGVHPESYALVDKLAKSLQLTLDEFIGNKEVIENLEKSKVDFIDAYTLEDILKELRKPGRDPRKKARILEFDSTIKSIQDLRVGTTLSGIVTNVTNFGAFVNIGIKENGLIHKSNLSDGYVEDPSDYISLHEHVEVEVLEVDATRKRIGLKRIK